MSTKIRLSEILQRMGFTSSNAQPDDQVIKFGADSVLFNCEYEVPLEKMSLIDLKAEGRAQLFLQEVDMDTEICTLSTVREC